MAARHYELVLMLDPEAEETARDRVAEDVRKQIEQAGTLDKADNWGMRKMAYEIRQRNEADYRYYRFQAENELLERLDHNLKIAEGTLRFRIFKIDPESPSEPPPPTERVLTPDREDRREARNERRGPRRDD